MRNKIPLLALLLLFTFILAACGTNNGESLLEDKVWVLKSYGEPDNLRGVLQDTEITATFNSSERKVTGSAGCNSYFGPYEVKGGNLSVPGSIAATEMACLEPEGVMAQENMYLRTLQSAESYKIQGNELRIDCGDEILVYTAK